MLGWLLSAVAEGLSSGHEEDQKVIISAFLCHQLQHDVPCRNGAALRHIAW